MGLFDRLFNNVAHKLIDAAEFQQSSLGKTAQKLGEIGMKTDKAMRSASNVQSQILPVIKRMMTKEISIDEFNRIYEMRMYNFQNQRSDIRALKQLDSEGVYAFHNITEGTYFIGKATYLFRKIKRIIDGYEYPDINSKMKSGCRFAISAVRLVNTDHENVDSLLKYYKSRFI